MSEGGWILLHRKIQDHWLYPKNRAFTKLEAWMDMIFSVNYKKKTANIGGQLIEVGRGECLYSLDTWSKRWNWTKSSVRRFLELLQKDNMIEIKSTQKTTHLKVLNYETYQPERNTDETQMKQQRHTTRREIETPPDAKSTQESTHLNNSNYDNYKGNRNTDETQMKHNWNTDETQMTPREKKGKKEMKGMNINIPFEQFWNLYDKKVGDKKACKKKWEKLKDSEREYIMKFIPEWKKQFKEKQFQPYPATFLNQRRWESEDELKQKKVDEINKLPL